MYFDLDKRMRNHLEALGFVRKRKNLFSKTYSPGLVLYLDYRDGILISYGYRGTSFIPANNFKDYHTAVKIETALRSKERKGDLMSYMPQGAILSSPTPA